MVDVPTMDDYRALETRVAALESGSGNGPTPPQPGQDTQSKRIASLIERMGVNTFSSLDQSNVWGSWPADYSPASVIDALRWIVQDSGFALGVREYHYANRAEMQKQWFPQITAAFPEMRNIICIGANGGVGDVASMIDLVTDPVNNIMWCEGLNEPNTDFGSGTIPFDRTLDIQRECYKSTYGTTLGPSIVAGTPHPEGWITSYCQTEADLAELNNQMDIGNGHYYPPGSPDVPGTGYSVNDYVGGLWGVYANKQIALTEFNSTLYNNEGNGPSQPGWSGARSAYYTLTTLFRCAQNGTHSLWWYALFDYGSTYRCGLFPTNPSDPREDAFALRALCSICADRGDNRRTFQPQPFTYSVTGGDETCSHDLYQGSDGVYYIALWRSLPQMGGTPMAITMSLPSKPQRVEEFNISKIASDKVTNNYPMVQSDTSRSGKLSVSLDGSARIIRITQ